MKLLTGGLFYDHAFSDAGMLVASARETVDGQYVDVRIGCQTITIAVGEVPVVRDLLDRCVSDREPRRP